MNSELEQTIDKLLADQSSGAQRKAALKQLGEIMEEDYILNLPPQKPILVALDALSQQSGVEATLKTKAKKLIKEYRIGR
jgi:hypothetical protein